MIELIYVDKQYPISNALMYVKDITINKGEVVGILGENGSGKTTLLKAIMGMGEVRDREVRIDGKPAAEQYAQMAFMTEEGSFLPSMTPPKYAEFLTEFFPRFDRPYYDELLRAYELPANRNIRTFSKGQKMKLELCAGLAKKADYLIMDEPFVGKDIFSRHDSIKRIIEGLTGNETVLITTHLIDEIENVIDRAIILHKGLIRADVYMDEIREQGLSLADAMLNARSTSMADPARRIRWPD